MKVNSRQLRKEQVKFAVGMASIDGGHPSAFTKKLLDEYEICRNGHIGQL